MNKQATPPTPKTPPAATNRIARFGTPLDPPGIWKYLPGLYVLRHYKRAWLVSDLIAGLVLTAVLVPVGMAYSQAAGLPAIYGLYATIIPLLAYAVFGPSRIMVLGPDSSLAPMIAVVILPLAAGDPLRAVSLASLLAILAGSFGVLAGILKLGFITDLLAKPIRYGYMNGIALTVLVSQLPKLFGFSVKGESIFERAAGFGQGLLAGQTNWAALLIGTAAIGIIWFSKRFKRIPGVLVAVSAATLVSAIFNLANRANLQVVGPMPRGLPALLIPAVSWQDINALLTAAIAIAVVSFADTSVLSRIYAAKYKTPINPNQEMIGLGLANVASGLFQGFAISSSASRTPVAESAGAKTQAAGIVGALAISLLLILAPGLLSSLPTTALAAVVIVSALGLFEIRDLRRLYRIQPWEFWLSLACFLGVAVLGPIPGMMIAIAIALAEFIWDAWRPHYAILARADGVKGYHDVTRYPNARRIPGLVLFRWDAPLFFANAEMFRTVVMNALDESPTPVRWLVVAAEPVTSIDITAVDMLNELDDTLQEAGIELAFAEMKDPVKDKLKRFGVFEKLGRELFFNTLGESVKAYVEYSQEEWVDWSDNRTGPE